MIRRLIERRHRRRLLERARQHLGREVIVTLHSGEKIHGRLDAVRHDGLLHVSTDDEEPNG